jgi:hypothetical protein
LKKIKDDLSNKANERKTEEIKNKKKSVSNLDKRYTENLNELIKQLTEQRRIKVKKPAGEEVGLDEIEENQIPSPLFYFDSSNYRARFYVSFQIQVEVVCKLILN